MSVSCECFLCCNRSVVGVDLLLTCRYEFVIGFVNRFYVEGLVYDFQMFVVKKLF